MNLVIVACSGRKNPLLKTSPLVARDAYAGQGFVLARDYLESKGIPWIILSAKYGLIWPDTLIADYNEKISQRPDASRWQGSLTGKRRDHILSFDRYICLGGEAYCRAAELILGRSVERPFQGLGIGYRLQRLKQGTWQ